MNEPLLGFVLVFAGASSLGDPGLILLLAFGVLLLAGGILIRGGYLRRWAAVSRSPFWLPRSYRNFVFAAIPLALVCLLIWLGFGLYEVTGSAVLATYVWLASLPVAAVALYVVLRAPAWSKPRWLRTGKPPVRPSVERRVRNGRVARAGGKPKPPAGGA